MIHQLFSLKRNMFFIDSETTGVDPRGCRIIELAFEQWDGDGRKAEWSSLVNPSVPIPEAAIKIHGIRDERMTTCRECAQPPESHPYLERPTVCEAFKPVPFFKQIAAKLAKGFTDCDFAGKNTRFDLRFLSMEMAKAGVDWSYAGARIVDIDRLEALAEPRNLGALHKKYTGAVHDGAHGAMSDVRASVTVIAAQLQRYPELPRDLDILHAASWPGWIDASGKFKMVDGVACFGQWGKHSGRPMKDVPIDYYDFILKGDFDGDVKALAREAKLGRFPT